MKDKEKTKGELFSESEELHQELDRKRESEVQSKLLEKTLLGTEENLRSILSLTSDLFFVIDPDGRFKCYYHPSSEVDLYTLPEEFMGKHFNRVLPPHVAQMLERAINDLKDTGQTQQFDYPLDIKGNVIWFNARLSSFKYQPEGTPAILVSIRNITERKKAEEALRESEEKYRATVEQSADNIYIMDIETKRVLEANAALQNLLGYTDQEIKKLTIYDFIAHSPKDIDHEIEELIERKRHFIGERQYRRKDGSLVDVEVSGSFIAYGGRKALSVVSRYITEHKRAEEKLKEVEQEKGTILNSMAEHVVYQDKEQKVLWANRAACESVGLAPDELVGRHCYEIWQKLGEPCTKCPVAEAIRTGEPHQAEMTSTDGRVWVINGHPVRDAKGDIAGAVEITLDITERKRAEGKLRFVEQEKATILNSMAEHVVYYDKEMSILWANKAAAKSAGLPAEEMAGRHCYEVWRQKSEHCINCPVIEAIKTGEPHQAELTNKDGGIWFVKAHPVRNTNGGIVGAVEITLDITQRKNVEQVLKQSERDYRGLFESAHDAILILDPEEEIVLDVNQRACTIYGFDRSEFIGMSLETISKDVTRGRKHIKAALDKGFYHHFETCQYRKDGTEILLEINASVVEYKGKRTILSINRDITERKKMQEELLKAKKLESIGILAGGIAHDFNNILTGILGNISVAKAKADSEDEIFRTLVKAEKASLRAKDLTQQLLIFSKGGAPIKETTSIGELIEDSVDFVLRGSNVRCEFSIPDGLWPVEIDKGQINQVLNNLIINADQSMPDGGLIKVSAENISLSAKDILLLKKGRYVKINIKDQGIGIPKQHQQKIFDPYFTTKKKGDGLGLATSYSIVKNHNGYIQVESELGIGSTLFIYLPASLKKVPKKKPPKKKTLEGKGKILVMDDEDMVREVVGDLLAILGYEVEFAKDGDEVIGLYK
ncbi:MAG: PAS domain S-box protein, partial [Candidatus Zixiibacteriota bacterium]